jgi:hypothetical protein
MTYNTGKIFMPRFRPRGMLAKSASEDLFRHTLSRLPTLYGKLAYLASLRDSSSGTYRHHGLSAAFGREDAGNALRESHQVVFLEWLNSTLSDKYDDLTQYIASLDAPSTETVGEWLHSKVYRTCVPASASVAEKEYFVTDLEALLVALSFEGAAGKRGQGS